MKSVISVTLVTVWTWLLMLATQCSTPQRHTYTSYPDSVVDTAKVVDSMNRTKEEEISQIEKQLQQGEAQLSSLRVQVTAIRKRVPTVDRLEYVSPY